MAENVQEKMLCTAKVWVTGVCLGLLCTYAHAQEAADQALETESLQEQQEQIETDTWLQRINLAAKTQNYQGVYVIAQPDQLFSLHAIHLRAEDGSDYDLITKRDGAERLIFKAQNRLYAVFPQNQQIALERETVVQMFPGVLKNDRVSLADYYQIELLEQNRVAGRASHVLKLVSKDQWRFSYKLWVDEQTDLLLRLQVLGAEDQVLEQLAFTDISIGELDADVAYELPGLIDRFLQQGYQLHELDYTNATPDEQGWSLREALPGFITINCIMRPLPDTERQLMQWVLSDGLVSVSIFMEPVPSDVQRHEREYDYGATHSMSFAHGQWWVTLVGEVPVQSLQWLKHNLVHAPDQE